jgi:hypothetical protein
MATNGILFRGVIMRKFVLIALTLIPAISLAGPQITISEKHWDYGFVPQNSVLTHAYQIKNTGDDTLRIESVKPGCSCTAAPIQKQILPPGDSTYVELIFDTKTSRGKTVKNAQINSNDPVNGSERIDFSCTVFADSGYFRPVIVTPSKLEFDAHTTKFNVTIQNDTGSTLALRIVDAPAKDVIVKIKNNTIQVGKRGEMALEWKGTEPEYDINSVITLETGTELLPRISIPYTIKGQKGQKAPEKHQQVTETSSSIQTASSKIGQVINKTVPAMGVPVNKTAIQDSSADKIQPSDQ